MPSHLLLEMGLSSGRAHSVGAERGFVHPFQCLLVSDLPASCRGWVAVTPVPSTVVLKWVGEVISIVVCAEPGVEGVERVLSKGRCEGDSSTLPYAYGTSV